MDGDQSGRDGQSNSGSLLQPNAQQGTGSVQAQILEQTKLVARVQDKSEMHNPAQEQTKVQASQPSSGGPDFTESQLSGRCQNAQHNTPDQRTAPGTAPGTAVVTTFHGCGTVNHKGMINILLALALLVLL
ncbi:uncharacterized protein CGFF_03423 [Nakaseomyces glabratus]|nr:uncharacterized protein CGFF_03423 [Nakaseomyces glabratus]